jgi:hypothetical protein
MFSTVAISPIARPSSNSARLAVAHQAQVHQLHLLLAQRAQVVFDAGAQVFGRVEGDPAFVGPAGGAHFGTDYQVLSIRMERLEDKAIGNVLAVVVGGINKIDAAGYGSFKDFEGLGPVGGLAPDAGAGEAHGAVAEPVDGKRLGGMGSDGEGRHAGSGW